MSFDWIEEFMGKTVSIPTPEIYRLWSAITAVSGVLERKVYTEGSAAPIYPNLFTLLIGPPASGKTNAIRIVRNLWVKVPHLNIAPDNVTKASLIDVLSRSLRTVINGSSEPLIFSSLTLPCSEFGVFFTHHDLEFLSVLTHIYDNPEIYNEERRTMGIVEITRPHLVILAGTQPQFLSSFLPEEAWGQGFTSRIIMIYADEAPVVDLFSARDLDTDILRTKLVEIFGYKGPFTWTEEAKEVINIWNNKGRLPAPTHGKLTIGYNGRRALHAMKLSMISSAARCDGKMTVTVDDFLRAQSWLLAAEKRMPDIFASMGQKSDQQLLADLHFFLYRVWSSVSLDKRKPIPSTVLYEFLHSKVPSEKIARLIEVAEKTGYIRKGTYPDEWIPELRTNLPNAPI